MNTTAHTTVERGLPLGPDHRGLESGRALAQALFIDWHGNVATQATAAIHDLLQAGQLLHTVTAGSGLLGGACESTDLHLVTLDRALAAFANSGFCKLSIDPPTSSPTNCSIEVAGWRKWACLLHPFPSKTDRVPSSSPAAGALARIKRASELTTEALARLVGVSRRTLHLWLAGGQISQRNEERLRALAEALEAIAAVAPETARQRLMERIPGYPRIYDLLAEGRFEAAIARGTGAVPVPRPVVYPAARPPSVAADVLVGAMHDAPPSMKGQIDRRLTKRLR
jgi:transcriptional regulator with XRE-family HTH domain